VLEIDAEKELLRIKIVGIACGRHVKNLKYHSSLRVESHDCPVMLKNSLRNAAIDYLEWEYEGCDS